MYKTEDDDAEPSRSFIYELVRGVSIRAIVPLPTGPAPFPVARRSPVVVNLQILMPAKFLKGRLPPRQHEQPMQSYQKYLQEIAKRDIFQRGQVDGTSIA